MSDTTVLTMPDGSTWKPSTSRDEVSCVVCNNVVDTAAEIASYPEGNCTECGSSWTGDEKRSTIIQVTIPDSITGGVG
jgi:hypothetical protein|tara:strand:- start:71 stop:304 length:234 start_codon:yes stop_codon:yes gene_type:complete